MATPKLADSLKREALQALADHDNNQMAAASALGISRTTLQGRLRAAALDVAAGDQRLLEWATPDQSRFIKAVAEHGSVGRAAKALGEEEDKVSDSIDGAKIAAAVRGYSPEHGWRHPVPSSHVAKGVSSLLDDEGKTRLTWVKADLRQEVYNELVKQAIAGFIEGVPQIDVPPAPLDYQSDIIPWIQIGDAHIGMLAHAAEVGENFDLKIAERELCAAISQLIDELPPCERLVINDLGDATHYDNLTATTAASGHALDADGRHPKMLRVYSRTMRYIVERALTKAQHVDVLINQGNHSRINDFWMRELLTVAYAHTGRVNVLDNDNVFTGYRMGKTLVMVHHSDKCPPARLVGVMTSDLRADFGETDFHYIDIGHVHHHFVSKEHPSVVIESWNHLASNDKWAHDAGYRSRKAISVVLRSRTYGEVGRRLLPIEEVRARLVAAGHQAQPQKKGAYTV